MRRRNRCTRSHSLSLPLSSTLCSLGFYQSFARLLSRSTAYCTTHLAHHGRLKVVQSMSWHTFSACAAIRIRNTRAGSQLHNDINGRNSRGIKRQEVMTSLCPRPRQPSVVHGRHTASHQWPLFCHTQLAVICMSEVELQKRFFPLNFLSSCSTSAWRMNQASHWAGHEMEWSREH